MSQYGSSALSFAMEEYHAEVVQALLAAGAYTEAVKKVGELRGHRSGAPDSEGAQ